MKPFSSASASLRPLLTLAAVALLATGCHKRQVAGPPVATPSLSVSRTRIALGSPIDLHYHFVVAPDARFSEDYRVMVHFVNAGGDLMWTDDHEPPVPTSQWKPGQTIDYTRTMFVPVYPYVGPASIEIGLYSARSNERLPLSGADVGQRAYRVAQVDILPQTASVPLSYLTGWNSQEVPPGQTAVRWRWTQKEAVIVCPNPKADATFFLDLDNPSDAFPDGQQVTVSLNDQTVATFALPARTRKLERIAMTAAQFGAGASATIRISADKSFVPATIPAMNNKDPRELGVRVFNAFLLPASE